MSTRKAITEKEGVYFITFSCTNWLPLFKICDAYDNVYSWLNHLKSERHYTIGYVITPSHVHAIIAFSNTDKSINNIVSNGKRFMAYNLVKLLKEKNRSLILNELSNDQIIQKGKKAKNMAYFKHHLTGKNAEQKNLYNKN